MTHEKYVYKLIKKRKPKVIKNTNIAPGMHCEYRGREREQKLKQ